MFQRFEIGEFVSFRHEGTTLIGHIRGRSGSLFAIETAAHEIFHVPEANIGGRVGEVSLGHAFDVGAFPECPSIWM